MAQADVVIKIQTIYVKMDGNNDVITFLYPSGLDNYQQRSFPKSWHAEIKDTESGFRMIYLGVGVV